MHLCSIMCFSSSIICLLIVTSHSSALPDNSEIGYGDDDDQSNFGDTSHISSNNFTRQDIQSSSDDVENLLNATAHRQKYLKNSFTQKNDDSQSSEASVFPKRRLQSADDDIFLPLPKHKETSTTHMQRRNSHSDHGHLSRQTGAAASSKADKLQLQSSTQNHNHHHHNDTDDDHDDLPSDYDDHHHMHEQLPSNGNTHHHKDNSEEPSHEDHNHHHHTHDAQNEDHNHDHHEDHKEDDTSSFENEEASNEKKKSSDDVILCENNNEHGVPSSKDDDHSHNHDHSGPPSAEFHQHYSANSRSISGKEWLYATLAVVIISLCGLFSVAVVPIMQKWFYHTLLQFLVGLAVGSLSGDGLLHLMPHAILDGQDDHDHSNGNDHQHANGPTLQSMEKTAIWRGLAALGGIFLFFIAERLLGAFTTYRRQKKEAKLSGHPKNMIPVVQREEGANNGSVGEKLAQPKKNSYDHIKEKDEKETIQMLQTEASPSKKGSNQSVHEVGFHGRSSFSLEPDVSVAYRPDSESSVIVSEHHGHGHGHSHDVPQSVTAVAWMVIMGDGLHNFCDGLAIGAAFASGDADGISTTVAVFCHELPHELGDFAMLLKTGMKVKQALFYNALSSVLCFVGMVIGVSLGNVHSATNWVFAGTAGMFLYIALVDMLPELTSTEPGPTAISTLAVQVLGISIGICIMLLIALYEHELHSIVS